MSLKVTRHAFDRCLERSIPVSALDLVLRYGAEAIASRGALQVRFDLPAVQSANADGVPTATLRQLRGVVLIVDGGVAVTAWRDHAKPPPPHSRSRRLQRREGRAICRDIAVLEPMNCDEVEALS